MHDHFPSTHTRRGISGSFAAHRFGRKAAGRTVSLSALAMACLWAPQVQAQTLSDDYWINVQAYYPKVDTNVRVDANTEQTVGTDIDFERDLDLDRKEVLPAVSAGARFGRVVVGADFFKLKRSGSVGLAREIEFDGTTYPVNARVDSGFSSDIYRLTVGYALIRKPDLELSAALGVHATNFRVSVSGEASAGGEGLQATARRREVLAPLPTIGLFGTWQPAPRVELTGRVDYLSLKIKDYDGKLLNVQAGAAYQIFEHASLGIAYRYVDYRLGVEKDAWSGHIRYKLRGPALVLQASF